MCVISVSQVGSLVPEKNLENMCNNNNDGFGISFIENNEIKTYKTMNKKTFIKKAIDIQEKHYKKSHILIHCRIATHGLTNKENCHPFKINRSTVFAHNGILNCVKDDDVLSDSRIFKNTYLKYLRTDFLDDKRMFSSLEDLIGIGNKIVFLTTERNLKSQVYIMNENEGTMSKGVWFSNKSYKLTSFYSNPTYLYQNRYGTTLNSIDNHYLYGNEYIDEYSFSNSENNSNIMIPVRDSTAIEDLALFHNVNIDTIANCDDIDYDEMYMEMYGDSPPYMYKQSKLIE